MLRTRFALLTLLLLLATLTGAIRFVSAQTEDKTALKFDEFGDILYSDLAARLDNFAVAVQNQPSARGFLIVYRTRRDIAGLSHRLAMRMKNYLVNSRGLEAARLATVDGGIADHLTQELWIVPAGAAPIPRSDARIGYLEPHDFAIKVQRNFDSQGAFAGSRRPDDRDYAGSASIPNAFFVALVRIGIELAISLVCVCAHARENSMR